MIEFAENEFNISHLSLEGYVELHKYRYLYFVLMLVIYIFVVCCNCIIIYIIINHKSLHEPMYIFIAALLLNAVFVITCIYPKLLTDFLTESHIVSYSGCLFQAFLVYSFGSAEFSILSVMAYDRYVSICKPLQYHTLFGMKTVKLMLVFAWLWPFCQISGMVILIFLRALSVKICEFSMHMIFCDMATINKVSCGHARVNYMYGMWLMLSVVFLPLIFIIFTYARILIVCLHNSKDFRQKAVQTCAPHLLVLVNFSLLAIFDILKDAIFSDHTVRFAMALQLIICPYILNPIIYGLKMKEISERLKKLLCLHNKSKDLNL